tara:strand:+ start:1569 stop:2423 length:855 start_codon:yes stop_codon:yes gene_type:complete
MKILIFGATGWLGKNTISYCQKNFKSAELICVSSNSKRLSFGGTDFNVISFQEFLLIKNMSFDYFFYIGFLTQEKEKLIGKNLYINKTSEIINGFNTFSKNNSIKKALLLSSGAVYWKNTDKENSYSLQKILQEEAFVKECEATHIEFIVARIFSIVAPFYTLNDNYAFTSFIKQGSLNKNITITAKSKVLRSYLVYEDLLRYFFSDIKNKTIDAWTESLDIEYLANIISKIYGVQTISNYESNVLDDVYKSNNTIFKNEIDTSSKINISLLKGYINLTNRNKL